MFPGSPCRGRGRPAPVPAGTPLRTSPSSAQKRRRVLWQGRPGGQGVRPSPPQPQEERQVFPQGDVGRCPQEELGLSSLSGLGVGPVGTHRWGLWAPLRRPGPPWARSPKTVQPGLCPWEEQRPDFLPGERPPGGQPWLGGRHQPGEHFTAPPGTRFSAVGGDGPEDLGPPASFLRLGPRVTREDTVDPQRTQLKGHAGSTSPAFQGRPSPLLAWPAAGRAPAGLEGKSGAGGLGGCWGNWGALSSLLLGGLLARGGAGLGPGWGGKPSASFCLEGKVGRKPRQV